MFDIGFPELILILVVVLVLFGPKRVPEVAKALGQSIKAFKAGIKEGLADDDQTAKAEAKKIPEETKS